MARISFRLAIGWAAAAWIAIGSGCAAPASKRNLEIRPTYDRVGFATTRLQIDEVLEASEASAREGGDAVFDRVASVRPVGALCPHDDHLYAGPVYVQVLPHIAKARTILMIGVTHRKAREILDDPKGVLIFDDFDAWEAPRGPVEVDTSLRRHLIRTLPRQDILISRQGHANEHSIEAMLPFLQSWNHSLQIVPILVTGMPFERMDEVSGRLADALGAYAADHGLVLGRDLALLISVDAVHYGPDFSYSPYGVGEAAHAVATGDDIRIGESFLTGTIVHSKLASFAEEVWGKKITWCGRYSVPFGLLSLEKTVTRIEGTELVGIPVRYATSLELGVLPIEATGGLGTTAPANEEHWVGYWGILYGIPR
jgi:AmmeMemoRadiSam system protein B